MALKPNGLNSHTKIPEKLYESLKKQYIAKVGKLTFIIPNHRLGMGYRLEKRRVKSITHSPDDKI